MYAISRGETTLLFHQYINAQNTHKESQTHIFKSCWFQRYARKAVWVTTPRSLEYIMQINIEIQRKRHKGDRIGQSLTDGSVDRIL